MSNGNPECQDGVSLVCDTVSQTLVESPDLKKEKPKRLTVTKKFFMRMDREGRYKDFRARMREMKKENGKGWGQNQWVVMKEFGYAGPESEHKLHAQWEASEAAKIEQVVQEKVDTIVEKVVATRTFEEALSTLPLKADTQIENDWILAHPAMARKARQKNNLEPILISADDILTADHGPAPSRAAAIKLQHWANKPDELYKALTGAVKKTADGKDADKDESADEVEDFSDIDRILKEMG